MKWLVFSKEELILSYIVLVTLKEWPLFRNRLNYTQVNVGAKVEPPTALPLNICVGVLTVLFKIVVFVVLPAIVI